MTKLESKKTKKHKMPKEEAVDSAPSEEPEFAFFLPADQ